MLEWGSANADFQDAQYETGWDDNLHYAGDAGQGIANLMRQPGGHLAQRGQMLGPGNLGAVQPLDLFAALTQLPHHVVKVAAQVANLVIAVGKADVYEEVALLHPRNLILQLHQGPVDDHGQHHEEHGADDNGAGKAHGQHLVARRIPQGQGDEGEQQQAVDQHQGHGQQRFDLPVQTDARQALLLATLYCKLPRPILRLRLAAQKGRHPQAAAQSCQPPVSPPRKRAGPAAGR